MAEEFEDERARKATDGVAAQLALMGSSEEARDHLRKHSRLLDLEIDNLQKQDEFEVSHLRWRRFNDQMKGAMQIMLVAVGALIVVGIAAAVWNASQANGLVVDAFSAPPDFEQRGMGGDVIAGDITDRLAAIRAFGVEHSFSSSNEVKKNASDEIKVEIPETGVSISEAWRYLRRWLGSEQHLTGSARQVSDGMLELSAVLDDGRTFSVAGAPGDLAKLEQKLAEEIYQEFDPVNFVNYLSAHGRHQEAYRAAATYVTTAKGEMAQADSFGLWSYTTADATGDMALALERARIGVTIDPKLAVLDIQEIVFDEDIGRDGDELAVARTLLLQRDEDQLPAHRGRGFGFMQSEAHGVIALLLGDFANAEPWYCDANCSLGERLSTTAALAARMHDVEESRTLLSEAFAAGFVGPAEASYFADAETENWSAAVSDETAVQAAWLSRSGDFGPRYLHTVADAEFVPRIAVAEAHLGRFAQAHASIDRSPADCISCLVARGEIDLLEKKREGAAFWFGRARELAPSIPFASAEWGRMLLSNGDLEGAIAQFTSAHMKGPHFADPLEMWGEALIRENRSDLALAKFEEASKYTPNWGRLHLKWGEALLWSGKSDEARKQFVVASHLYLTQSEEAELTRVFHG